MRKRIAHLHTSHYLHHFSKRLTNRFSRVYNPLNKLVRRIKDMRTGRDIVLILFGLALALFISGLQFVINPSNRGILKTVRCDVAIIFIAAIVLIFILVFLMRILDRRIENQKRERHRVELQAEFTTFKEELKQDIGRFLVDSRNEETKHTKGKSRQKKTKEQIDDEAFKR